ncbi:GNAT family N-acetyltransferase [Flavobacterium sp. F-380]|uniref:GNAT family N-acetyltransferase n=1 Tax=Flavobacterium kayseriense TaxID=2764714 RepID=A0ABR7J918_9FLAO|nr:GNAT family N-acetyltransferase [Flavobacterium kayseriense]MBC5841956.1 GNAT family N-acetyltransferase [Flavobacterium kayseriense]MBC5848485.1 GNAT family N-acetyltransferase [Flavobacterium kayseriense]
MSTTKMVRIIPFTIDLKDYIKILNVEWLQKYFRIEDRDEIVLSNPQEEIIDKGGLIYYATYNDEIVGTVSLLRVSNTVYEVSKMAVTTNVQGLGIGKILLEHCFQVAKERNATKLILYSNTSLQSAIHLYYKYGFVAIPLESGIYERADIKMEKVL